MKKIVIFLITLTMLLSLALTGCGQSDKTDNPNSNDTGLTKYENDSDRPGTGSFADEAEADLNKGDDFDAGDSGIMDGTNNPGGDSEDYPLGNDESIPDGGAEWEATHGGGSALSTNIDVMDYIDGNYWRMSKMMIDLGYNPAEAYGNTNFKDYRNNTSPQIRIGFSVTDGKIITVTIQPLDDSFKPIFIHADSASESYIAKTLEFEIHLDTIQAIAYACEQFNSNPNGDPFDGLLRYENDEYWLD